MAAMAIAKPKAGEKKVQIRPQKTYPAIIVKRQAGFSLVNVTYPNLAISGASKHLI
jgi:hypothetical protein